MNNINIHNPFIGLRTYEEADAGLFRGRTSSTLDLYHMISGNDVVVLHSESGEGKSSILNAGLFPLLRDERYFPIKVNFTDEDFSSEAPNFDNILYHRIEDAVNKINGDSSDANIFNNEPNLKGNVTIVPIADLQSDLLDDVNLRQCAWWLLRNYTLNAYGASLIPVLIFDQFEEVFTRPKTNAWTEDFFIWLSATLNDVAPQNVINLLRNNIGNDTEFPKLRTEKKFKALFSLRTEYMGELDYWGIQRHHIAVLKNSRYCLKPLTEQEADEILELQPLFSSEIRSEIKAALRSSHESKRIQTNLPTIPAMLLSVVSTTASNNIIKNGRAFDDLADISDSNRKSDIFTSIIEQFYQKEVADAAIPKKVLKQFENVLVDDKGRRVRIKVDSKELRKFEFEGKYKRILEQRRLIKCNQINEEEYVELTHDALAKVIVRRRNFNEINKSRWSNYALSVAYIALVLLGITYWAVFFIKDYCSMHNLVKNQIVIAIGSTPIILCGYKRFTSSINVKERIFTIVAFYFILWVFIRLSRNLIDYIAYPVYFHQHCNVESLIRELILIVFLTLFLWIGCKLVTWKQFIHKLRWPAILGIPIIFAALYPYIYAFKIVIAYILVTIAIFNCSSQVFGKNRNSYVLYIISTLFLILSYHLSYSPSDVRKCCVIAMIAINLIFFLYSISRKRSISISQTLKDCTPGRCKWIEAVSKLFGIYSISVILFLGIIIGYKLNDLYSFGGLIITTPLIVYLLSHYVLTVQDRTIAHLLYTVCLSSVIAIWCAQYVFFHFWATIAIWLIGVLVIIVYSLKLSKQDALKRNGSILKCSYKPIILFGIVAYFMPCILMGYNILSLNNTAKIFNRTEYIKEISMTLLYVRSNDGKIGLMNRKGNMIIPCIYDQIIPNYNTIRDNLWDNNNKYSTDFHGFTLIDDWQILDWELTANIKNGRILTYNEASALYRATCNSKNINTTIEENRIYKEIVRLIKRNDTVISKRKDWTFNYKNIADLKCLNDIDFDSIKPDLSATSVSFQKCYLDTILPNMKFGEYGIVSDVLSPSYSWDKTINEQSSSMEHSTYFTSVISDNVTGEMLVRRELGNRLSNLALYFLTSKKFKEAEYISNLSFTKGKYQDNGKVYFIEALLSQGKSEKAVKFIRQKENELFNENSSIFPEEEYAWIHIRYTPLLSHLSSDNIAELKKNGYTFKIDGILPFDYIQILPDSVNGDMYRFYKYFHIPNCTNNSRIYSYFVKNGKRVSPPLSFWSYPLNYGEPILAINCITKKRQFITPNDVIGVAYTCKVIGDANACEPYGMIYSQKFLNLIQLEYPNKYQITKTVRRSTSDPSTFISPKLLKGEYDHAWPFSEGLAAVEVDGKIGFINVDGDIVINPQFESPFKRRKDFLGYFYDIYSTSNLYKPYFRDGVCPVYDKLGNLIWIDKSGKITKEPD